MGAVWGTGWEIGCNLGDSAGTTLLRKTLHPGCAQLVQSALVVARRAAGAHRRLRFSRRRAPGPAGHGRGELSSVAKELAND
jgi:hypothetical protein